MDLELTWLRSWVEVVDSGGFARAASRIYLSQPRVSAHVASLERTLGCTLIDRRIRPLTLTDEGKRLLPWARAIIASVDETVADFRSNKTASVGRVTVASFASASYVFLPKVIGELRAAYPLIDVGVLDGDVQVIETALAERRVAVALRPYSPEPADRSLVRHGLWREPFALLAPQGHEVLDSDRITLERIAKYPVITIGDPLADQGLGYEVWASMRDSRVEAFVGIVSHQPTTLAAMVKAGHGVGLLNLLAATMVRADGLELRTIDNSLLYRDVALWWHSDQPLSRPTQAFVDLVVASERPAGTSQPKM